MCRRLCHSLFLLLLVYYTTGQSRAKSGKARALTTPAPKEGELTDECPDPNGFFADGYQCDKYYECIDGVITEKLCPDGMVFNDYSPQVEKCDLPFNIDCSQRPELQEPKPTTHCPRQNGYFAHEDSKVCDKFYFCVDGKFNMITCPAGLVYNEKTGICTWPDEAKKKGCSSEGLTRPKRVSIWPEDEASRRSVEEEGSASEESSDRSYESTEYDDDEYDSREERASSDRKKQYRENNYGDDFFNPDFSNFDDEFSHLASSRESDDDYYEDSEEIRRREDVLLDGYIREYVDQMNRDPSKASGAMDLSYYEKIAEAAVENSNCFDNCPKVDVTVGQQHPRYPDTQDCQFFYVCINGEIPRRNGCKKGQVFNEATGSCDWPRNVPECKDWYKGILTDEELYALEHPRPRTRNNSTSSAGGSRRKPHVQLE